MNNRAIKDALYSQVARIGKAVASPKRLELIEVLCQGEKSVEQLAIATDISIKLASAHLKALRQAHLVDTRRDGKNIHYRLVSDDVADFWVGLRSLAEERLVSLRVALVQLADKPDELAPVGRDDLLARAQRGEITVIDVRPVCEFRSGHLPYANSMPLEELRKRLAELPLDKPVVAYCRGPFCLMAKDAVELLRQEGYRAIKWDDGVAEWRALGLPVETH
jgi:rhodanese-related sulfurtransferase